MCCCKVKHCILYEKSEFWDIQDKGESQRCCLFRDPSLHVNLGQGLNKQMEQEESGKSGASTRGGKYCVAGLPNGISCTNCSRTPGVSMHRFPKKPALRRLWTQFVRRHRANFDPSTYSTGPYLCSRHFDAASYSRSLALELADFDTNNTKRFLVRDAVPSIVGVPNEAEEKQISDRDRRMVCTNQ